MQMKLCEKTLNKIIICYIILTWNRGKRETVLHGEVEFTNEFFVVIDVSMAEKVKALLKEKYFDFQSQVVDDLFIASYEKDTKKVFEETELQLLTESFHGMVKDIQQCRIMQNADLAIKNYPIEGFDVDYMSEDIQKTKTKREGTDQQERFEEEPYWDEGEGIDETWKLGITGEGITVAILDIGFTVDHPELQPNINKSLTFNVVTYDADVSAVLFHNYIGETIHKTNHGNDCASVVAAVKGNKMCSAGVAYNSKIAALSIGTFTKRMPLKTIITTAGMCKGLAYQQSKIDIYSSSWTFSSPFEEMDIGSERAIIAGIIKGRQGKGNVYVSAVGPVGNEFTNSIFIIAVNQIGVKGTIPKNSYANPGILISSFGKGKTRADDYMFTASQRYKSGILCNANFQGSSAATPKIAGMAALILQNSPDLTWRQLQHLLVRCSNHTNLKESINFKRNGAGYFYHRHFGFGYLNVAKCIELADTVTNIKEQMPGIATFLFELQGPRNQSDAILKAKVSSLNETLERVQIKIHKSLLEHISKAVLYSPMDTSSVLIDGSEWTKDVHMPMKSNAITSTHFWGERTAGRWTLSLKGKFQNVKEHAILGADLGYIRSTLTQHFSDTRHHIANPVYKNQARQFIYEEFQKNGLNAIYQNFDFLGLTASQRLGSKIFYNAKFQGSSAATSMIAGIIALILQIR
ncbi:neuroendocrine convertase 2-like [Mya arenaria]|nr:neuroendocrine convertase 2-like [Mya arenaria]